MKKELLVVIDMINGFVKFGNLADPAINKITPNIIKLIKEFKLKKQPILEFKDWHNEDDAEFATFPRHCVKNTPETEIIDELKPYEKDFLVIRKNTTNGMDTKEAQSFFKVQTFDRIIITGCCTDICLQQFALSLKDYLKAQGRDTQIVIPANAAATFNSPQHDAKFFHNNALSFMQSNGITIEFNSESNFELLKGK